MRFFDKKNTAFLFLCIVVLLTLFVRLRHLNIAFERDEGEYAYAAQEILRGGLPYIDFYNMKLPGTYYFFALMFAIGGDSAITVKIGLLIVNLLNAFLVFLIARIGLKKQEKSIDIALFSAGIYLLFSLSYQAQGWTANSEHFVLLPTLLGVYCIIQGSQKRPFFYYFLGGTFLAWAFLSKQHAIGYLFFPVLFFLSEASRNTTLRTRIGAFGAAILPFGIGLFCVFGCFLAYFYQKNALSSLYFYTFEYANAYIGQEVPFKNIWVFRAIFWDNAVFWLLHFGCIGLMLRRRFLLPEWRLLAILGFCGFLCIHPGWFYRPHYFQMWFPTAAILSGVALGRINAFWQFDFLKKTPLFFQSFFSKISWQSGIASFGILLTCILQFGYFFGWSSEKVTSEMYGTEYFTEIKTLSDTLPKLMSESGKIGILGPEPEVFFYTKKRSATGFLYHYPIYEKHKFAHSMATQLMAEFEKNKPEIVLYFCTVENIGKHENAETMHRIQTWFQDFSANYELVGKFLRRKDDAKMVWKNEAEWHSLYSSHFQVWQKIKH